MKTSFLYRALQAAILGSLMTHTLAQTATAELSAITTLGCYSSVEPLDKDNTNTFQSSGKCQPACANKGHAVMAITGGSTCYCGDILPATDNEVDESKCNSPCQGYDVENCGGIGYWRVFLTGLTGDVETAPNSTSSSSHSTSSTSSDTQDATSQAAATVTVSQPPTTDAVASSSDNGPNKIGIAVGVVVGVIVIASLAGGAILYLKQKRRREIEEEHKAQAAINSFVGSRHSDTKSDARLDPSVASSYRRESIGSIADERDFSRRILQVRNPDRGSINSVA